MNFVDDWNKLDSFIFFFESRIKNIIGGQKEDEPDVELMIQAETEHLRSENEDLKRREIPIYLIEEDNKFFCPKCGIKIVDTVKYCPNCGHRVIRNSYYHMGKDEHTGMSKDEVIGNIFDNRR